MNTMTEKSYQEQNLNPKIQATLDTIYNIPALPDIVSEALRLLNNKNTSNQQLIDIISRDQAFVAKVLAVANSPIYALRREVSTLDFAIMVLGYTEIRHIVVVISFLESFKNKNDKFFDQNAFWLHSLLTASIGKSIAEDLKYSKSGEVFVAGFLHDFGISIINRYFRNSYMAIYDMVMNKNVTYPVAEKIVLGMTHSSIAKYLMEKWNFPAAIKTAATYHHNPSAAIENAEMAGIIHVADFLATKIKINENIWDRTSVIEDGAYNILGVTQERLNEILDEYEKKFTNHSELLGFLN
ncbi:MAG: HDOD domain-containing protein [Ignavibacteriales bacterium]